MWLLVIWRLKIGFNQWKLLNIFPMDSLSHVSQTQALEVLTEASPDGALEVVRGDLLVTWGLPSRWVGVFQTNETARRIDR